MKIQTTRFGELHVEQRDVLNFPEGILGFEHLKKFFVVDPGDNTLILWLQSVTDENIAFPIIEPILFDASYSVRLLPVEMSSLQLDDIKNAKVYCILTIPSDVTKMSANLKAPVIINSKSNLSRQVVLQDNKLPLRLEVYKELKKRILNYQYDDSKGSSFRGDSQASELLHEHEREHEHELPSAPRPTLNQ
ncbi:MAG: flagellar assembly protein FliW [Oligoflexia bacterium]|nr:flagellar assembly protein FliW [Oligoflexia bacterium]MBF0366118.1 flagellar assembly protein FliW [Oligoflexia bacterium]